jgi:amino acid adenylation domain-containing protein
MNNINEIPLTEERATRAKALFESAENRKHASYWEKQLDGELPVFELLPKLQGSVSLSSGVDTITTELSEELSGWVRDFSKTQSSRPSVVFLAVYKLLLHKYSGHDDIIVGITVENSNFLPIRTQCEEAVRFEDLLQRVQNTVTDALDHTDYSFPNKSVFKVAYTYQNSRQKAGFLSTQQLSEIEITEGIYLDGESDLELEVVEHQASFIVNIKYNHDIYSSEIIQRFFYNYSVLLSEVSKSPDRLAQAYAIITEQEKQKLLIDFNNTHFEYPKDKCIHQLFAKKVIKNHNKIAVVFENEQLSYQQLYDKCCDLALFLQSLGVKPDSLVGLCLERSIEMMVGIQGILLSGGAYVPMDPDYPEDRLAYMLEDSKASIVLCQSTLKDKLTSLVSKETKLIALDESWDEIAAGAAELKSQKVALLNEVQPHHLAYVIYTSGSTGKPKGVMVEHQALMNRIDWMQRMYRLNDEDIVLQKTPFSFDVSVWEFVWPLMAGASVVFAKPGGHKEVDYLENLIEQNNVTTLHFVPSMLHTYLEHAQDRCNSVKQIFCSGEALDSKSATEYRTKFPKASLHNLYGPTEAAIDVTFFNCSQLRTSFVPIGAPISNIQIYILDKHNNPQPLGVPGELHIAGDGLARGYHNRTELTNEKFVANPFTPGTRMYKSGDLARWMDDGNIEYLGRIDTQVKIRGFRIETGEIEARLNQHPDINNSCVVVQGHGTEKKLIAFYHAKHTKADTIAKLSTEDLRSHLLQTLPDYMLPSAFVSLENFPVTPNGKLNRGALERMDIHMESSQTYVAPSNETEQQLVNIWAEVLHMKSEKIGIHDNFFELGGHSLLVAQLISKIRNQIGVDLPLNAFFDLYTIADVAEVIKAVNYQGENEFGDSEFEEITL